MLKANKHWLVISHDTDVECRQHGGQFKSRSSSARNYTWLVQHRPNCLMLVLVNFLCRSSAPPQSRMKRLLAENSNSASTSRSLPSLCSYGEPIFKNSSEHLLKRKRTVRFWRQRLALVLSKTKFLLYPTSSTTIALYFATPPTMAWNTACSRPCLVTLLHYTPTPQRYLSAKHWT